MKWTGLSLLLLCGCVRHYASPPPGFAEPDQDPPGRVARLSFLEGAVSFKAAGTGEWVAASLNRPLTIGDSLWTDLDSRAELTVGTAAIRMDSRTGIRVLDLGDRSLQVSLIEGAIRVSVRAMEGDDAIEVSTPAAALSLVRTGDYRVEASADSDAVRLIVRGGMADVAAGGEPFVVRANQEASLAGPAAQPRIAVAPPLDAFDIFCDRRERGVGSAETLKHVSREVIGWEDLDPYGNWEVDAAYGPLWIPRTVVGGWAPYRFGHWIWVHPWGWTWVDDAPWGFAPFHYGRWVFVRARWCWVPGPPRVRVVYAPALVVFVGGGEPRLRYHIRIGVHIGIGWFPLAPHEIYIPPYRASRTYITNINVSHTVIRDRDRIHNVDLRRQEYRNRGIEGAITTVPEDVFARGGRLSGVAAPMPAREAREVRVTGAAPPVAPGPRSAAGDGGDRRAARPPDRVERRTPVVRRTPPPSPPPFDHRRQELERNPGYPIDTPTMERIRREQETERAPEYRRAPAARAEGAEAQRRQAEPPPARQPRVEERERRDAEERRRTIEQERGRVPETGGQRRSAEPEGRKREEGASGRRR